MMQVTGYRHMEDTQQQIENHLLLSGFFFLNRDVRLSAIYDLKIREASKISEDRKE